MREGPVLLGPQTLELEELRRQAALARGWLLKRMEPGQVVAIASDDARTHAFVLAAALGAGLPLLILDPSLGAAEAKRLIALAGAEQAILDPQPAKRWALDPTRTWTLVQAPQDTLLERLLGRTCPPDPTTWPACLADASPVERRSPDPEADAVLLATSGTSDRAKLARLSHRYLVHHAELLATEFDYTPQSRVWMLSPISHIDGVLGLFTALHTGTPVVRPGPFSVTALPAQLDLIYRHQVSDVLLTPTVLALCFRLGLDLDQVFGTCTVVSTASALDPALRGRFEEACRARLLDEYGMTEIGNAILQTRPEAGNVGSPVGCEVRIVDPEGQPVEDGLSGELEVRGPGLFSGYVGEPSHRGWFATGDLAVQRDGRVQIVGRRSDRLETGGRTVNLGEVARALRLHEDVQDAAVTGLSDPVWGHRLIGLIEGDADLDAVRAVAAEHLPAHALPRALHRVDALPRGRSGKVLRDGLAQLALAAEESMGVGGAQLERTVLAIAARAFRTPESELSLLTSQEQCAGWDSMAHLDLVVGVERAFGVRLSADQVLDLNALADVVELIRGER